MTNAVEKHGVKSVSSVANDLTLHDTVWKHYWLSAYFVEHIGS